MQFALDTTNLIAAVLNVVVATLMFWQLHRLHGGVSRIAFVLAAFFAMRAVDRIVAADSLVPYSAAVDLAVNGTLIVLLVLVARDAPKLVSAMTIALTEARGDAERDALTGVLNRRGWERALSVRLLDARTKGHSFALLMLDIDHFKRFNDTRGHQAGDELLATAAGEWARLMRQGDVIARYGGEEFAIILAGCSGDVAEQIADRLRADMPLQQTCSIGLAVWSGTETGPELVARADLALYAAKHAGRNRVTRADGDEATSLRRAS